MLNSITHMLQVYGLLKVMDRGDRVFMTRNAPTRVYS